MKVYLSSQNGHIGRNLQKYLKKKKIKIISKEEFKSIKEIDIFIHNGASTPSKSKLKIFYSNILSNFFLLRNIKKKKISIFFFISSISVYGKIEKKINEQTNSKNISFYGFTKKWGENFFSKRLSCNVICLRLPAILTKGNRNHLLGKLYDDLKNNRNIILKNHNKIYNSFLSAENLFDFIFSKELNFKKGIINLGIENRYKLLHIVSLIKKKIKSNSKIIIDKSKTNHFTLNISKAKKKYSFKPFSLDKTLYSWLN